MSTPDTFGHRIGVFILAEISAASACAVTFLLAYIAYSAFTIRSDSRRRWRIESPVHLFLLNQLVFDLIQALGGLMNMKWAFDGTVHRGSFCTAQGLIKQLADVGTALSAGNVAINTFSALIFRLKPDTNVFRGFLIVAGIWISIILNVAINVGINGASRFYGPTGPWCFIVKEFQVQITVGDFMWMWISAFSSLLAYLAVFLVLKGFITVEGWRSSDTVAIADNLPLSYPIIYIITVLPLAATRYSFLINGHNPPFGVIVFADGLYLASGLFNVCLYAYTRPFLLPHGGDSPDNQSISIRSEFAQSRSDFPRSTILGDTHVVSHLVDRARDRDPSPIEHNLKSAGPVYDTPEMAQPGTLPITTHASHEGETVRKGLPAIFDDI
ncbi:hypothetical protein EDB92DRAFT_1961994 [Lactarius akahatsu]|uniref:Glucose receptor Git3 N-terminal domain-containing protein n=1 Tax=Lactarius akahatsu TaxID=416441 RepID=A0AAD4LRC5_9AGAM|nr:hypothetical protein EDB92DRAFT_1961994 [Lactarius akahatsu]